LQLLTFIRIISKVCVVCLRKSIKNVITDMSYDFIADLAQTQLNDMAAWNITQISVTGVGSYSSTTYSMPGWSLYIMVPDEESVENAREQIRDNYN